MLIRGSEDTYFFRGLECIRSCADSAEYLTERDLDWILAYCTHCVTSLDDEGRNPVIEIIAKMTALIIPFASNRSGLTLLVQILPQIAITPAVLSLMAVLVEQDPAHSLSDQILSYFWNAINSPDIILQQAAISSLQLLVPFLSPPSWLLLRCLQLHQLSVV